MNQILVTEKIIVTPGTKRKRNIYKFNFFFFSFLACLLLSCHIYAGYDRMKSEQVAQDILLGMHEDTKDNTTISVQEGVIVINALADDEEVMENEVSLTHLLSPGVKSKTKSEVKEMVAPDGTKYYIESTLKIPSLGIEYPVLSDWSDELLKISLNKLHGPEPNEIGNYVIIGHNYRSGKMFGKLPNIQIGDTFEVEDLSGRKITYKIYTKYVVEPEDLSCTSQLTDGKKEVTLITCNSTGKQRIVVKAQEI